MRKTSEPADEAKNISATQPTRKRTGFSRPLDTFQLVAYFLYALLTGITFYVTLRIHPAAPRLFLILVLAKVFSSILTVVGGIFAAISDPTDQLYYLNACSQEQVTPKL